jgi:metallo-beta-lactamase class B
MRKARTVARAKAQPFTELSAREQARRRGEAFVKSAIVAVVLASAAAVGAHAATHPAPAADNRPVAPFKIADNLYYVGAADISSFLIATPAGLIVIDGGYAETAPQILANIRTLGFDPKQVKILLNSHAHYDHAEGLAALKRATGARLLASRADAPRLEDGGRGDPAGVGDFEPVKVDGLLKDGQVVELGGVKLTARLTPGHTRGCTSWQIPVRVDGRVRQALSVCSTTVHPLYRLTGPKATYVGQMKDYETTFAKLRVLPCDIFLGAHGNIFNLAAKRGAMRPDAPNPFLDEAGCRAYVDASEKAYRARLAAERAEAEPPR